MRNLIIVFIAFLFFSCDKSETLYFNDLQKAYIKENFNSYKYIYDAISDTLRTWKNDSLDVSKQYFFDENFMVDSLILFNSDSSKLLTKHLEQNRAYKNAQIDNLPYLAGLKIQGRWYFFFGMSTVIDRASYQDSIYAPLTFDELSYLAREHMQGAFFRDTDGKIKVYDSWFKIIQDGYPNDSLFELHVLDYNRRFQLGKIDKAELDDINKEIAASFQPPEPPDTRSWFKKTFGKKKLFETEEWKEYIANKNRK